MYKPDGHSDVSPYLVVADAQATLDFLAAAFGAVPGLVHHRPDGTIMHAEARLGDTIVMMGQMAGGPAAHVHVYVADPEAVFARALDAGGTVAQALTLRDDGDRRGGVTDPTGTTWWIARTERARHDAPP